MRQAASRRRRRVYLVDGKAIFRGNLFEQLLDGAAPSAMPGQQEHTHEIISLIVGLSSRVAYCSAQINALADVVR